MNFPMNFIAATVEYSDPPHYVPAPYLRKSFSLEVVPESAALMICGLGLYELYVNGKRLTKGALAPYINNPDDLLYYDQYEIAHALSPGENVIGLWLGNGLQNNPGGHPWGFDQARWRGAPSVAMRLNVSLARGETLTIESDKSFKTAPSPIYSDDLRNGEYYDARNERPGWNTPGFDDSDWKPAIIAPKPRGEARLCEVEPIVVTHELAPVSIVPQGDGYLFDFGTNCTGVCRLTINGTSGQELTLYHGDHLLDGQLNIRNINIFSVLWGVENDMNQKDIYICKGGGTESWTPMFTYHGFQYVLVRGLTAEQAVPETLRYLVMNSDLKERGGFNCSDETVNTLQEITRRSTLGNFIYYPLDCPHREKNGWTGDAALSAEHILLNLSAETSLKEWMWNIRKAQKDNGGLPGIIPDDTWGLAGGCAAFSGPVWDSVLIWLPYYVHIYRGDKTILEENVHAILRYLEYLTTLIGNDGLIDIGLGDWCPACRPMDQYKSPSYFTSTVISMDICEKAAYIFGELNKPLHQEFALSLYNKLRTAIRSRLIDFNTFTAEGNCQTSQAVAIFCNVFEPGEKPAAFRRLLEIIQETNSHLDVGIIGARVLFHVLADFGETDLALRMITQPTFPSYGWWVAQGATTLWENFTTEEMVDDSCISFNHHFWGDISHFFIRHLAGINYNPHRRGGEVDVCPKFAKTLEHAEGFHIAPEGEIRVRWERRKPGIALTITVPEILKGSIRLQNGFAFDDGLAVKPAKSGTYKVVKGEI